MKKRIFKLSKNELKDFLTKDNTLIDVCNNRLLTLLHLAVLNKDLDLIDFLVKNGADVNYETRSCLMPLSLAIRRGDLFIVKYFIKNNAIFDKESIIDDIISSNNDDFNTDIIYYFVNNNILIKQDLQLLLNEAIKYNYTLIINCVETIIRNNETNTLKSVQHNNNTDTDTNKSSTFKI